MYWIVLIVSIFSFNSAFSREISQSGFVKEGFARNLYDNITSQIRSDLEKRCASTGGYMSGFTCQKENQDNGIIIDNYEVTCRADCSGGGTGASTQSIHAQGVSLFRINVHHAYASDCLVSTRLESSKSDSKETLESFSANEAKKVCADRIGIENDGYLGMECEVELTQQSNFSFATMTDFTNRCQYSETLHEEALVALEQQRKEKELMDRYAAEAELKRSQIELEHQQQAVKIRAEVSACLNSIHEAEIKRAKYTVKGVTNSSTISEYSAKFLNVVKFKPAPSTCADYYKCQEELQACQTKLNSM